MTRGSHMNIQQMMKQAQQMQERLQRQLAEMRVEATSGGGMVSVVVNGLQDLVLAAVNDAQRKVDEAVQQQMSGLMGGLRIPGLS
jgi:nucleoid-associated protein EbfC